MDTLFRHRCLDKRDSTEHVYTPCTFIHTTSVLMLAIQEVSIGFLRSMVSRYITHIKNDSLASYGTYAHTSFTRLEWHKVVEASVGIETASKHAPRVTVVRVKVDVAMGTRL